MTAPTPEDVARLVRQTWGHPGVALTYTQTAELVELRDALRALQAAREAAERDAAAHAAAAALEEREALRRLEAACNAIAGATPMAVYNTLTELVPGMDGLRHKLDDARRDARAVLARPAPSGADALAAALRQARAEGMQEAIDIVRGHAAHIPHLKARDYPDDMMRLTDDIAAAILAAAEAEERSE